MSDNKEIDNKYKKYRKKLDAKLKNQLGSLQDSIFDQKQFNSLISKIISQMQIDENIESKKKKKMIKKMKIILIINLNNRMNKI